MSHVLLKILVLTHRLFTFTDPDTRVVVLLVWLIFTIWVTDLSLEVVVLSLDEVSDTR